MNQYINNCTCDAVCVSDKNVVVHVPCLMEGGCGNVVSLHANGCFWEKILLLLLVSHILYESNKEASSAKKKEQLLG